MAKVKEKLFRTFNLVENEMNADSWTDIANRLNGYQLISVSREDGMLNVHFIDKEIISPTRDLYLSIESCTEFSFQALPNSNLLITDFTTIELLNLKIEAGTKKMEDIFLVPAKPSGSPHVGYLRIKGNNPVLFNSDFDPVIKS